MDPVWGSSRKSAKDNNVSAGGSKLVQLQRQSSAIGAGLPSLHSGTTSAFSGTPQPGLSAFLTPSEPVDDYGVSSGSKQGDSNSHNFGLGSFSSSSSSAVPQPQNQHSQHYQQASGPGSLASSGQQQQLSTGSEIHPLHFNWVFWFMHRAPGSRILNYESAMKRIASFGSVEDFWAVYSHLRRPHELPHVSDYHLFKQGVRPVWEDATNINGGKWIVRLKKGLASRYWENLVMAVIGDQFDVGTEICGAVLSIRGGEDILSLWNQSAHEGRINLKIRDTMKRVLNLPADTIMEYKTHNDALKDNTSFRNTDVFR
ncbi:translation initiation factor 4E [Entomortierella parvispora]|uniref:Translation initiation factor 4E n=1 Tax=Entomortierella parvispora TaxID=205924 RepID=A0A9P3LT08_9FUNG|nr:translation initiation factor 4E [Entomortierella parvispora]